MKRLSIIVVSLLFVAGLLMVVMRLTVQRTESFQSESVKQQHENTPRVSRQDRQRPSPEKEAKFLASFAAPIALYGKVVDQDGLPVSGANVLLRANSQPWQESVPYERTTDSAGNFSIEGVSGLSLYVEVSKPGYYRVPSGSGAIGSVGTFSYGSDTTGQGIHTPNASKPVVFVLKRGGPTEPLIIQSERHPRVQKDGTPTRLPLDPSQPAGPHFVQIQCWTNDLEQDDERQYDWKFRVSVPGGGLVLREDVYGFEAPLEGYIPTDEHEMPKSLTGTAWKDTAERSYFLRFDDGIHARVNIRMIAHGAHFVVFRSWINPKSGSRNLESGPDSNGNP
jgi:hypothetical protein